MSKTDRLSSREDADKILAQGTFGVLSTISDEGQPYGVPVNYVYLKDENCIFFHCGKSGKKIDNILFNNKVSFTVVINAQVIQEKYTTHYESVIATGIIAPVINEDELRQKLFILCERFSPDFPDSRKSYINKYIDETAIYKIDIKNISGKRNIKL